METQSIRLRLVFEDRSVLSETQRSDGMNQSWLLIEPNQHRKISDVCNHLLHIFNLRHSCPNGILLYMDGFVLPPSESTRILKDKEILCVKRKGMVLDEAKAIEGVDAGNLVDYVEVNNKEPVHNGMLLLANEEFDKEIGGYKSESEEEKLEDESLETISKKRKISTKLRSSKKKKQRSVMNGVEDEVAKGNNNINNDESCPMKTVSNKNKPNNEKEDTETVTIELKSPSKVKRKKKHHLVVVSGVESEVVRDETCIINDDVIKKTIKKKIKPNEGINNGGDEINDEKVKSPSNEDRSEHIQENVKGVEQASTTPDEGRKGASRSARRKKAKRQWRRELALISQKPDTHLETEVSKAENKEANDHPKGLVKQDHVPTIHVKKNLIEKEKINCNGNTNSELVACVVKPGHIRFEPLEEGEEAKQIEVQDVAYQWNGITSKKKGQKWGQEKYSTCQKDDSQNTRKEPSPMLTKDTEDVPVVDLNDFDKLPLYTSPKEGDVIAYRLVELSSSWTPELSSFRVGRISHYDANNNIILKPVPEYPIVLDKMEEDGPDNNSLYKEDGTLEIKFAGLVDVHSVEKSKSDGVKAVSNGVGDDKDGGVNLMSNSNENENVSKVPSPVSKPVETNKEANTWDEVMKVLSAKKSELLEANQEMKKDSEWNRWSYRALRGSALGPTMAMLRSNNNI